MKLNETGKSFASMSASLIVHRKGSTCYDAQLLRPAMCSKEHGRKEAFKENDARKGRSKKMMPAKSQRRKRSGEANSFFSATVEDVYIH